MSEAWKTPGWSGVVHHDCPDGSLLIEALGEGWRMGISLEENLGESSWYIVSRPNVFPEAECGPLPLEVIRALAEWLRRNKAALGAG